MTRERADEIFGKICFETDDYELRAKVEDDGLHAVALRRENGKTLLPRGFILGSSSLKLEKRK